MNNRIAVEVNDEGEVVMTIQKESEEFEVPMTPGAARDVGCMLVGYAETEGPFKSHES